MVDLSDLGSLPARVQSVIADLGGIQILVNVAGIASVSHVLDLALDEWGRVQTVNLKAPLVLIQAVAAHRIERGGGGRIVNVSSSSAFRARSYPAYAASKVALVQLTRNAAAELGRHGILVNSVAPGITARTGMATRLGGDEELARAVMEGPTANLLGLAAEPEDVAEAILFLCVPASRRITGQVIHTSAGAVI